MIDVIAVVLVILFLLGASTFAVYFLATRDPQLREAEKRERQLISDIWLTVKDRREEPLADLIADLITNSGCKLDKVTDHHHKRRR